MFVRVTPENDYLLEIDAKGLDLGREPTKKSKLESKRDFTRETAKKKTVDEETRLKMQEIMVKKAETDLFSGRRCSICQSGGISLNADCNLADAAALNYVLYECSKCRAAVHRDCIPWDTPDFYDAKGNNLHLWKCNFCKSGLSLNNCLICNSNTEGLRKKVGSNNIHYVCGQLFGIQMGSDNEIMCLNKQKWSVELETKRRNDQSLRYLREKWGKHKEMQYFRVQYQFSPYLSEQEEILP